MQNGNGFDADFDRKSGLGGTDIAGIMGVSPYKSPYSVWASKLGMAAPFQMNDAVRFGQWLEHPLAENYEKIHDVTMVKPSTMRDEVFSHMYASPDGLIENLEQGWECKTTGEAGRRHWGEPGTDFVPKDCHFQCLWYLDFMRRRTGSKNWSRWNVTAAFGNREIAEYVVLYHKELVDTMIEAAHEFWNKYVIPQLEPPKDESKATRDAINAVYSNVESEEYLEAGETEDGLMRFLYESQEELNDTQDKIYRIQGRLKGICGHNKGISGRNGKVTWSEAAGAVSWKKVAMVFKPTDEVIEAHRGKGSRRFRFTANKEALSE